MGALMSDVTNYFVRGKECAVSATTHPETTKFLNRPLKVIQADENAGVLAAVSNDANNVAGPVVFIPFDGTTTFSNVARGAAQFAKIEPATTVIDLGDGTQKSMSEF